MTAPPPPLNFDNAGWAYPERYRLRVGRFSLAIIEELRVREDGTQQWRRVPRWRRKVFQPVTAELRP